MDAVEALERLGGIASLHALLDLTTRRRLRTAVESQAIRKAGHDRYALPAADQARRTAVAGNGWATDPLTTVLQCARDLPFADALAIADSALRHGDLTYDELQRTRTTTPQVRRVLQYADGRAANPFESTLRAIAIECGLHVVPQYEVLACGLTLHPDLADPVCGVILEAESWEFHGKEKRAFESDCERYNALVVTGWFCASRGPR